MSFNLDDYEPVANRLTRWLEQIVDNGFLPRVITDMVHRGDGWCVFRAELWISPAGASAFADPNLGGILVATGWAEEHVTDRGVNSTSHVENCETSAVGRALANAGFAGSDPSKRASREEMTKVQRMGGQPAQYGNRPSAMASEKQRSFIMDLAKKHKFTAVMPADLTFQDASRLIEALKAGKMLPEFDGSTMEEPF